MTSPVIIIPARYDSMRFPGKPLAPIVGAKGSTKSLIQRTWERAISCRRVDPEIMVYVATDDPRIEAECNRIGAYVLRTSPHCRNGTERCEQAASVLMLQDRRVVINLQGDSPLVWPSDILALGQLAFPSVATLVSDGSAPDGAVSVVTDVRSNALYFSRARLPASRLSHIGIYAYRRSALRDYCAVRPSPLELAESLEQLRFLEHRFPVHCLPAASGRVPAEVNFAADIPLVEAELRAQGID